MSIDLLPSHAADDTQLPCLLLIDIDFFKRVNDTHGHLAGDYLLQHVAREIRSSVRGRDIVARYGGEAFAVLLRDTPRSGCLAVAENIRSHLEQSQVELPREIADGTALSVTGSVGGALYREGEAVETFIDRTDQALYQSQEAGRNRVSWS